MPLFFYIYTFAIFEQVLENYSLGPGKSWKCMIFLSAEEWEPWHAYVDPCRPKLLVNFGCSVAVASGGGRREAREASAPVGTFQGRHLNEYKKIRPVYDHLNALQLLISVHQRYYAAFKMHQIYIRLGLRSIRTLGSYPHSLVSWDKDGRWTNVFPGSHRPSRRQWL